MYKMVWQIFAIGMAPVLFGQAQNAAPAGQPDRATAYYHYALGHMYADLAGINGRPEYVNKAIDNFKLALKADPTTPLISEELSELYIQYGRLREAQSDAEEALRQNPNDINARRLLARIFVRLIGGDGQQNRIDEGMLKKAIEQYEKITALDPKDVDSWVMLGRLQKVATNSVEAQKAYKKALEVEPDNEDALTGLAMVYADLGDSAAAADLLKKLADKNPSPRALQALAAAYEQMKEYALAAETLKRAIDTNPPNAAELKRALAEDQRRAQQYEAAIKTYQELVDEEPGDAESYVRMSQVYAQLKNFAKAHEAAEKAKSIEPTDLEVRYNEVAILEAEGKSNDAIVKLKDILDSTQKKAYSQGERGNRIKLLERLAILYRSTDQSDAAVAVYRQMVDLDHDIEPNVEFEIINTYRAGKELTKAQQEADAAIKKFPDDRALRSAHATLLADMGKTDQAISDIKKIFEGKNDRQYYLSLAEIYDKGRKFDDMARALDAAEKLSNTKDEKKDVWFMRGAMYEKMKKADLAEAEFRKILETDPENAETLNYLGYMLADRGVKLPEALELINKALAQQPSNGAFLDSLGWVYFKMGKLSEAEENLRQALVRTPRDATVHDHLGDVLMRQAKLKEAIAQWQISLQEWEKSSPADLEPAEVAKVKNKLDGAKVRLAKEGSPKESKP